MKTSQLFRHSRLRLGFWYALVMGVILSLSGFGMYRSLVQSNWKAMEREMESIAGTLHDSLEPMLPASEEPTNVLKRILPELCLVGQPCNLNPSLIERHTTGISDRNTYYIRLFDHQGQLLAFSPNQPTHLSQTLNSDPWQTITSNAIRYRQFTIILHSSNTHHLGDQQSLNPSWGYLQLGRTLKPFDAEVKRIQAILIIGFPLVLGFVVVSSWWLSGLAMQPIYQSYQQQQQSQLYRLVSNLIGNAIQYTPSGGQVVVSLLAKERTALINIKDTGIGITTEEQSRIFERFYRVDSDRARKTGGTGLGLAIAQAIAHHHQGHLTVQSQLGTGSLFTIYLPCTLRTSEPHSPHSPGGPTTSHD